MRNMFDLHLVTPTKIHKMTSKWQQRRSEEIVAVILTCVYAKIILFDSITTPSKG